MKTTQPNIGHFEAAIILLYFGALLCMAFLAVRPCIQEEWQDHLDRQWHAEHGRGHGCGQSVREAALQSEIKKHK